MFQFVSKQRKVNSPVFIDYINGENDLMMKKIEDVSQRKEFDSFTVLFQLMLKNKDINNIRKIINSWPHLISRLQKAAINTQKIQNVEIVLTEFRKEFVQYFIKNDSIESGFLYGLPDEPSASFLSFYIKYVDYYLSLIEKAPASSVISDISYFLFLEGGTVDENESEIKYFTIIWNALASKFKSSIKTYEYALVYSYLKSLSLSFNKSTNIKQNVLPMFKFYFDKLNFDINNEEGKYFYDIMKFGDQTLIKFFMDRGIRGVWVQRVAVDLDNIYPYDDQVKEQIKGYVNSVK